MENNHIRLTATVTWITCENFGTYLQAYALQQVITKLGYRNRIISDYRYARATSLRSFLGRWKRRILCLPTEYCNTDAFKQFKRQYLQLDEQWKDFDDLNQRYDLFICGSDQIWTPYVTKINPFFYLGFTDKPKIAYAPSTGTENLSENYKKAVAPMLNRFSAIAVREKSSAKALSDFVTLPIEVVSDPCILLTAEEWQAIENPIETNSEDYLLCYFLSANSWYMDFARQESRRLGLRLKVFYTRTEFKDYGDEQLLVGPCEFISYLRKAQKVFTDSFHASIFCILFHKEFVTFKRFKDNSNYNQNTRITDLFDQLGLQDFFVDQNQLSQISSMRLPNYIIIEELLKYIRNYSLSYLITAFHSTSKS